MPPDTRRLIEVRLLVIVTIDLTDDELIDTLKREPRQPSSVPEVVGAEIVANLESVPYVEVAIVSLL